MRIGFDFDKTLSYKDTLLGFFLQSDRSIMGIRVVLYFLAMIATKFRILSNDNLKKVGVYLFLKGKTRTEIAKIGRRYAPTIKLNQLHARVFTSCDRPILVSAGFEEYLKPLFPDGIVVASRLQYKDEVVTGLGFNCFGAAKIPALRNAGISELDEFYTDSYSDQPVMDIAQRVFLVKGDKWHQIK